MSTEMPKSIWAMLVSCTDPAREEEFNHWYDKTHIPDLLEIPGVKAAYRYRNLRPRKGPDEPEYLAVYRIEAPDAWALLRTMLQEYGPKWYAQGRMIDCLKLNLGGAWEMIASRSRPSGRLPAKDHLNDGMPRSLVFGLSSCTDPARENEFNDWYTNVHLPDMLNVPGVTVAHRYKSVRWKLPENEARYLAIYRLDSERPLDVLKQMDVEMKKLEQAGRVIDCLKTHFVAPFGYIG